MMRRLKSIKDIFVVGEKNIFCELIQIISVAQDSNDLTSKMLKLDYRQKELTQVLHEVKALEKKSDEIAFKITEDITSGAISPNVIDSLLECVQLADDIVDTYYFICREIDRMAIAYQSGIETHHTDWDSIYENMFALAQESLLKLKQALSIPNISEILKLRKEIEALEEEGDEIKDLGFDRLYSVAPKLHFLEFYHYQELLHKCDDILDSCEDLSDLIVAVVTSILK